MMTLNSSTSSAAVGRGHQGRRIGRLGRSLRFALLALVSAAMLPAAALAADESTRLYSAGNRVAMLELYTSEGCSSCPPADRWLSTLVEDSRLWTEVVPLALHVNYWDRLGWPDRFATAAFGGRQRSYAQLGAISTVYTPGLVLDGREWRQWFRNRTLTLPAPEPGGALKVDVRSGQFEADYMPPRKLPLPAELHLAVLGFGLETEVRRGENAGRRLVHDFVVLGHKVVPLGANNKSLMARGELPDSDAGGTRRAAVAWVQLMGDPRPLQAAGGWLPQP